MDTEKETGTKKLCSAGDVLVSLVSLSLIHMCTHTVSRSHQGSRFFSNTYLFIELTSKAKLVKSI